MERTKAIEQVDLGEIQRLCEADVSLDPYDVLYSLAVQAELTQQAVGEIVAISTYDEYVAFMGPQKAAEVNRGLWRTSLRPDQVPEYFPEAEVRALLPRFRPPRFIGEGSQEHFPSPDDARRHIIETYAARAFFRSVKEQIATSPDLATFTWRLNMATNAEYVQRATDKLTGPQDARRITNANLYTQTKEFMIAHPDDAQAAFDLWQEAAGPLVTDLPENKQGNQGLKWYMYPDMTDVDISVRVDEHVYTLTHPALRALFERDNKLVPKNPTEIMSQIANGALDRSKDLLEVFEQLLMYSQDKLPAKQGALMQASIDLTGKILEATAPYSELAAGLDKLLKETGKASFATYVTIANSKSVLGALHETKIGKRLKPLTNRTVIADLPQAIDRICLAVMMQIPEADLKTRVATFEAAKHTARLMAQVGSQQKLDENVLTVGDVIVRYPDLTAPQLSRLMAEMQQPRSEKNSDTQVRVHRLYRELRQRGRKVWFSKHSVGRGLLM